MSRQVPAPPASTLRKYGMTQGDWRLLFAHQGGRCPACQRNFTLTRRACVDHDHRTGLVRGLLCSPCNNAIGVLHEDIAWLERSAEYLRQPPAAACFDTPVRHINAPPPEV